MSILTILAVEAAAGAIAIWYFYDPSFLGGWVYAYIFIALLVVMGITAAISLVGSWFRGSKQERTSRWTILIVLAIVVALFVIIPGLGYQLGIL